MEPLLPPLPLPFPLSNQERTNATRSPRPLRPDPRPDLQLHPRNAQQPGRAAAHLPPLSLEEQEQQRRPSISYLTPTPSAAASPAGPTPSILQRHALHPNTTSHPSPSYAPARRSTTRPAASSGAAMHSTFRLSFPRATPASAAVITAPSPTPVSPLTLKLMGSAPSRMITSVCLSMPGAPRGAGSWWGTRRGPRPEPKRPQTHSPSPLLHCTQLRARRPPPCRAGLEPRALLRRGALGKAGNRWDGRRVVRGIVGDAACGRGRSVLVV